MQPKQTKTVDLRGWHSTVVKSKRKFTWFGSECVKIKPLVELKNTQMIEELSIDEQMVSFKGISRLKQYISKKPYKWGFKLFCFS